MNTRDLPRQRARAVLVLSGKGGIGKTMWQYLLACVASRAGLRVLVIDADPVANMARRLGVGRHVAGLDAVLQAAGVRAGSHDPAAGAAAFKEHVIDLATIMPVWTGVHFLPAGPELQSVAQINLPELWVLRDVLEDAGVFDDYDLVLLDSGGRTGQLVQATMYAADVAYTPISDTDDAIALAREARDRVTRLQRVHPLQWKGAVLTNFSAQVGIDGGLRIKAVDELGEAIRAELPRRSVLKEIYMYGERLGDRGDVKTRRLAWVVGAFLQRDLLDQSFDGLPQDAPAEGMLV
jgi:chromosome partitioning protein